MIWSFKYLIFFALVAISCTEKYSIEFEGIQPKLVVECALLNIDSVHFLRLSLSKSSFNNNEIDTVVDLGFVNRFVLVSDALVIVSDDKGNVDTLSEVPDSVYYVWNFFNETTGKTDRDSILVPNDNYTSKGNYFTNSLKVIAGTTYFLKVFWNGDKFESSCYTPSVPIIDTITYDYAYNETKNEHYYVPYIWFKDNPDSVDYYLFKTNLGSGVWSRSILSDEFLSSGLKGVDVFKGEAIDYWRNAYPTEAYFGFTYRIEMHSITKEIYDYYKGLIAQFRNDGGVYTPTPASPPTNISNGALGYFRASCVEVVEEILPFPPE